MIIIITYLSKVNKKYDYFNQFNQFATVAYHKPLVGNKASKYKGLLN